MDNITLPEHLQDGFGPHGNTSNNHQPLHITSHYNKLSDTIRRVTPPHVQCTMFCGGKRCKYESSRVWASEQCVLNGVYSTWITEDVLAMCRLNTAAIQEFDIIGQFHSMGIKSVINLQVPGEHGSCSPVALHPSGFSYDPTALMDNGIYFYNYSWRDYGDASLPHLLDMVKVLSFSVSQGRVAVHCHAGLGRTGVLISSYLVYSMRLRANDAIRLVRGKRPGSVQSRLHILCVQQFEQFILPNCVVFCNRDLLKDKKIQDFTIQQYLKRQRVILHGKEGKRLRHIPKILNVVLERLLTLSGRPNILPVVLNEGGVGVGDFEEDDNPPTIAGTPDTLASPDGFNDDENGMMMMLRSYEEQEREREQGGGGSGSLGVVANHNGSNTSLLMIRDDEISSSSTPTTSNSARTSHNPLPPPPPEPTLYPISDIIRALLSDHINMVEGLSRYVKQYRMELNHKGNGAWVRLLNEKNLYVLTALLLLWLEHLRVPLLGSEELTTIVLHGVNPQETMKRLPMEVAISMDYLIHFLHNLGPLSPLEIEGVLRRIGASLTHRIVPSTEQIKVHSGFHTIIAPEKGKPRILSEGTLSKVMGVLYGLLNLKREGISIQIDTPGSSVPSSAKDLKS